MPELKQNILNFSYTVFFKYEGILSHSFDRLYVVTKLELPKVEDLCLTSVQFDSASSYLNLGKNKDNFSSSYLPKLLAYCEKIVPYVHFYKKQITYYNPTAYKMLANEIGLILPTFPKDKRHKRGIIESLINGFISLAHEGISSCLQSSVLFLTTIKEKYARMYERFNEQLKMYAKVIRILPKGYFPILLLAPSKLPGILSEIKKALQIKNKNYDLVLSHLYLYYNMKLVTFGIDKKRNLIIQFPVFVQPYTQKQLILYQIETASVPIIDQNEEAQSYTQLKIDKPYIALNLEIYISLCSQGLSTCKRIGYKYYCEELFVVKSKSRYTCVSAIYFNLDVKLIKENCNFDFYFNKTDTKPPVLHGGHEIILANWPSYKKMVCSFNNNIPVDIPSHPYVLLNWSILCKCNVEAESNFLLESLAACGPSTADLVMYFTANLAFVNYFDDLIDSLDTPILQNWTTQEQILPISLQSFEFNSSLLQTPKPLKDFIHQHKCKKEIFDLQKGHVDGNSLGSKKFHFNRYIIDIFLFITALISLIGTMIVVYLGCKHAKLKSLVTSIALQQIKGMDAVSEQDRYI